MAKIIPKPMHAISPKQVLFTRMRCTQLLKQHATLKDAMLTDDTQHNGEQSDVAQSMHRIGAFWKYAPHILSEMNTPQNRKVITRALTDSTSLSTLWTKGEDVMRFLMQLPLNTNALHVQQCFAYAGLKGILMGRRNVKQRYRLKQIGKGSESGKVWRLRNKVTKRYANYTMPLVVKEIIITNTVVAKRCTSEANLLMKLSTLAGMNLLVNTNRVCVPRFTGFQTNKTGLQSASLQLVLDYAGAPIYGSLPVIEEHCKELNISPHVAYLSILAQVCITLKTIHELLDITHNDLHLKNITIQRWDARMKDAPRGIRYVNNAPFRGDLAATSYTTAPPTTVAHSDESCCTTSALRIPRPCYLVTLIDFGLANKSGIKFNYENLRLKKTVL